MQTQKTTTLTNIKTKISEADFTPTHWTDGGEPAISAEMLNRYETTLGALMGDNQENNIMKDILDTISNEVDDRTEAITDIDNKLQTMNTTLSQTDTEIKKDIQTFQNSVCWKSFSN